MAEQRIEFELDRDTEARLRTLAAEQGLSVEQLLGHIISRKLDDLVNGSIEPVPPRLRLVD